MRLHKNATEYSRKAYEIVRTFKPSQDKLVCLNCTLPVSQCKGERACVKKQMQDLKK